jgi:hypothetical protein
MSREKNLIKNKSLINTYKKCKFRNYLNKRILRGKIFFLLKYKSINLYKTISHNLGFVPNVLTTDLSGNEISGVVTDATISILQITFSEPVSGYAYLS